VGTRAGLHRCGKYQPDRDSIPGASTPWQIYALIKGKGKVYPRTGHEGSEGEQRCSSTLSLTSTLDGGGCSAPRPGRFTAGKDPILTVLEVGWAPGPVCTGAGNLNPTGIRSPDRPPRGEFMPLYLSLILLFLTTFQSLLALIPRSFSLSFAAMSATFKSHTSNLR